MTSRGDAKGRSMSRIEIEIDDAMRARLERLVEDGFADSVEQAAARAIEWGLMHRSDHQADDAWMREAVARGDDSGAARPFDLEAFMRARQTARRPPDAAE